MEFVCAAGFWMLVMANGGTVYTDDPRRVPGEVRQAICRSWDSLPDVVRYTPFPARPQAAPRRVPIVVPLLGESRQGYPTCEDSRRAMRWSDQPCAPWTPDR